MRAFDFALPVKADKSPTGPDRFHEIKHDGYRLLVRRDGQHIRCFTRNGNNWADLHRQSAKRSSTRGAVLIRKLDI